MKVDLLKYMSDRLQKDCERIKEPGPVITISRLSGCPGRKVAQKLTEELTKKMFIRGIDKEWRLLTKEIMSESARELDMHPSKIKYVFKYEQKGILDDILQSHANKYYKSDRKIRNTVAKVIRNMSCEGNVVILGRGGVAITRDVLKSLHVNLEAPLEWRVLRASEKNQISPEEAEKFVLEIDKKRKQFRDYFEGRNTDYTRFDLTFNCMTLSIDEIVNIIIKAAEIRKLI
ncbi:MAG: cytidylate kinase-like family protein [Bacteroidales bacterium]|nr:cytidylate kinase-like family protein [Bacteroidales bacterium]